MIVKYILILAVSFLGLLFLPISSQACFCDFSSFKDTFAESDAVFVGKVVKIQIAKETTLYLPLTRGRKKESSKNPKWEKDTEKINIVTLEISEVFKGVTLKSIDLRTSIYNGGGSCGVHFKVGDSYIVFAHKRQKQLSNTEEGQSKDNWSLETRLKAETDKLNEKLPLYSTSICSRTGRLNVSQNVVETIRNFLQTGIWVRLENDPF